MKTVGIICEYNPFHLGHRKQLELIRSRFGADTAIVCLMSGNYVQRGAPALFDKSIRAEAALRCGADIVLELPVTGALSSAEGFAAEGVRILSKCCDTLCFGTESMDEAALTEAARALLSPEYPPILRKALSGGCSFPAARQLALEEMGISVPGITLPNNILGIEYTKAILSLESRLTILPIRREGSYHDTELQPDNPSATALRSRILSGQEWLSGIPEPAAALFSVAHVHTLSAGEKAVLYRLRTMTDEEFEALPYGSEGLWRKLMHAARSCSSLEEIGQSVKSRRYTRTRIDRMILCAFLGITSLHLTEPAPYARILAMNDTGRNILHSCPEKSFFRNAGEKLPGDYALLESRCGTLYGLFSMEGCSDPRAEEKRRIRILPDREAPHEP